MVLLVRIRVKTESNENVFKVECCGSSLLTSNRKLNLEKTVDF
jgi:hypothetical protein